jgi:hypothetical protein
MKFDEYYLKLFVDLCDKMKFSIGEKVTFNDFEPFFKKLKDDNAVLVFKMDGEKKNKNYSIYISSEELGEGNLIRIDTDSLESGLSYVLVEYARIIWDINI